MVTKHDQYQDQHAETTIGQKPVALVSFHASTGAYRRYKITTSIFGRNLSNYRQVCETII